MIQLFKLPIPAVLQKNEVGWTQELLDSLENGTQISEYKKSRYKHQEIKKQLENETHSKCAYCESKITHIDFPHIEHIKPKHHFPEDTYKWDNLTIACPKCNIKKLDNYDEAFPPLNPYIDNPEEHFIWLGCFLYPKNYHPRAEYTKELFNLNRKELVEKRIERMENCECLIKSFMITKIPALKQIALNALKDQITSDKEYVFMVKSILKLRRIL